jgi:hypothetical protein
MPSARVICPYCNTKLRIATDGGAATRAKCRVCKKTFTPTLIVDPNEAFEPPPSLPAAPPPAPLPEPMAWNVGNPLLASPPPAPVSTPSLSVPPPPLTADAAGRHRRREKVHDRPVGQLRPYEVILASAIILAVLGGVGFLVYQLYSQPKDAVATGDESTDRAAGPDPFAVPVVSDAGPKPRPKRLFGVWELRADDGRSGRLLLRPDGTLTASSTAGDSPLPDYNGKWFLLDEDGDRYVIEFGREHGAFDGYKVTLVLTNPDAFTLVETVKGTSPIRDYQRFVRATAGGPSGGSAPAAAKGP